MFYRCDLIKRREIRVFLLFRFFFFFLRVGSAFPPKSRRARRTGLMMLSTNYSYFPFTFFPSFFFLLFVPQTTNTSTLQRLATTHLTSFTSFSVFPCILHIQVTSSLFYKLPLLVGLQRSSTLHTHTKKRQPWFLFLSLLLVKGKRTLFTFANHSCSSFPLLSELLVVALLKCLYVHTRELCFFLFFKHTLSLQNKHPSSSLLK